MKFQDFRASEQALRMQAEERQGLTLSRMHEDLQLMSLHLSSYETKANTIQVGSFEAAQLCEQLAH